MNEPRPVPPPHNRIQPHQPHPPQAPRAVQPAHPAQPAHHAPVPALPVEALEELEDTLELEPEPEPEPIPLPADADPLEPIGLDEAEADDSESAPIESKIKAFGVAGAHRAREYKRQPNVTGQGSVRVKSLHGKLSDQGLGYIDDAINDWLEAHPEIEVKFVTSTVGVFEGKIREPALVLNVWY